MNRQLIRTRYDAFFDKAIITICSQACVKDEASGRFAVLELLQFLHDNPQAMSHGSNLFDAASLFHDGIKWVMRCDVLVPKDIDNLV